MITAQVSDKGQITIPADVRRKLGLKAKSRVEIEIRDNVAVLRPVRSIRELSGILQDHVKGKMSDWETVRTQAERAVAEQVVREGLE